MSITYRLIDESEYEASKQLWRICFPADSEVFIEYYFSERTCFKNVLAAYENEVMVAALHMLPYKSIFNGSIKDVCLIAGVATLPSHRMRGIAYSLLRLSFFEMKAKGFSAALLQPFNFDFYGKLGFTKFVYHNIYTADGHTEHVNMLNQLTPADMKYKYDAFMKNYNGFMAREITDCEKLLAEPREGAAVQLGDAYALYEEFDSDIRISELIGASDILNLVNALCSQTGKKVIFPMPEDKFLQGLKFTKEPFNMLRIIDASKFLINLPAEGNGTINISDKECPWNDTEFIITCNKGKIISADPTDNESEKTCSLDELNELAAGRKGKLGNICFIGNKTNFAFEQY